MAAKFPPCFYKQIRDARIKSGLTQEQLANALGVSRVTVCNVENGDYMFGLKNAMRLVKILGISLDRIALKLEN